MKRIYLGAFITVLVQILGSSGFVFASTSPTFEILNQRTSENKQCCGSTLFSRSTRVTGLLQESQWGGYVLQETWNSWLFSGPKRIETGAIYEFGSDTKDMGMVSRLGLGVGYHFGFPNASALSLSPSILYISPTLWKLSLLASAETWMFSDSAIFLGELGLVIHRVFGWPVSFAISYPMRTWFKFPFSEVRTDFGSLTLHMNVRF